MTDVPTPSPDSDDPGPGAGLRVIAIDGPAGSGKSTVAKQLAVALDLEYLDTGAMYRSVTFAALSRGVEFDNHDELAAVAESVDIKISGDGTVMVDGIDATTQIRGPVVTQGVSEVASNPRVRAELVSRQREWAIRRGGGVLEGRDIATAVFPDATLKIYLSASPEIRAARRAGEVEDLDYGSVAADIARRDALDSGRQHDPLRRADGAIEVDTSYLSIEEVIEVIKTHLANVT